MYNIGYKRHKNTKQNLMRIKKIMKWLLAIFSICVILFLSDALYIRDWRTKRSEERVSKNIILNYENRKSEFINLIAYTKNIPPIGEIEFTEDGKFITYFSSYSTDRESTQYHLSSYGVEGLPQSEFTLLKNGLATIKYNDTIIETKNWFWEFEGTSKDRDYDKVIDYMGLSMNQLDSLRTLVEKTNCETIEIYKDKSVTLRYDGHKGCQYEYFITNSNCGLPEEYVKIDAGIYCGLNKSTMFCGSIIYDK